MNPWIWVRSSIGQRGFLQTSKVAGSVVRDFFFDLSYGTDTRHLVKVDALDTDSENKAHAVHYQATKARPFLKLLQRLELPHDGVFVDFGSGKGRALLIAAYYGFKKVIGVEFSAQLCAVARRNVESFPKVGFLRSPIEVVQGDVALYPVGPEMNVFYLYNPFNAIVLREVLSNIQRSVALHPREIWLIYNTPEQHAVIQQSGLFPNCSCHEIGGNEFKVYVS